jgi:hypothetical protein
MLGWLDLHAMGCLPVENPLPLVFRCSSLGPSPGYAHINRAREGEGDQGGGRSSSSCALSAYHVILPSAAHLAHVSSSASSSCHTALAVVCSEGSVLLLGLRADLAASALDLRHQPFASLR